jgi:hypothetical protein
MKIRSKIDVITNSSTEVFSMKSDDFKNLPKGILSRKDREAFMVFETFEDIQREYMKNSWLECFDEIDHRTQMYSFRLSSETKKALEYFGISEEQQKAYEDEINLKRQGGLRSSKPIQDLLGTAWGFWYDHDWCESMDKLKEYCDQHGIPYKYLDP